MNTFVISSRKIQSAFDYSLELVSKQKIDRLDTEVLEFEKALGIEDVRNIQKKIFLKPFKGLKKATVILLSNGATTEAQNSMLKLLEEPPPSSLIFLITTNILSLLPTILSRAKVIELREKEEIQTKKDGLEKVLSLGEMGDSLVLAQIISKDKQEAIEWLEQTILAARDVMLKKLDDKQESLRFRKLIHKLELTHYDLKTTNVNPRLALENLFLNL